MTLTVSRWTHMGIRLQVNRRAQHNGPVDATSMRDWEADAASKVGAALLFWGWYLPVDMLRPKVTMAIRRLARGRALLRYPLHTAPARQVAATRIPMRFR